MHKGISAVIATLLMLVITVAIVATVWGFLSGIIGSKTSEIFTADASKNTVFIRNDGTDPITMKNLLVTIDGSPITYTITPTMPGLVSYWSFDEANWGLDSSGTPVARDSMDVLDLPIHSNPPVGKVAGIRGSAIRMDNTAKTGCTATSPPQDTGLHVPWTSAAAFASMPSIYKTLPQSDFTISFWERLDPSIAATGHGGVVLHTCNPATSSCPGGGNGGGLPPIWYRLNSVESRTVPPTGQPAGIDTRVTFPTPLRGQWHHMVYVFDRANSMQYVYINGTLISQGALDPSSYGYVNWFSVGVYTFTCVDAIPGASYDEVMIFSKALTPDEIGSLYNGQLTVQGSATLTNATPLTPGPHSMRICSKSMCNSVTVQGS